jgi:hypothetical protein
VSWTKRQFVTQAFEEIGFASYAYDLEPEQLQAALRRLDAMIATWNTKGIRLGYPLPSTPENSELDTETNVPDSANEAIYTNLAIRIAPTVGKAVYVDTKIAAKAAYDALIMAFAVPPERQLPGDMPSGAGNKPWRYDDEYLRDPTDPLLAGGDGEIEFN